MLTKNKSKQIKTLKFAILLPVIMGMLVFASCNDMTSEEDTVMTTKDVGDSVNLVEKIAAVHSQIEVQGNINEVETQGIDLLLQTISGAGPDPVLIDKVQEYSNQRNPSALTTKIIAVFDQLQMQGNISDEEERELKGLLLLTTENGFKNPLFQDVIQYAKIPFSVIDQVPIFPGCESKAKDEQRKCFTDAVSNHVKENFNIAIAEDKKLTGVQRIITTFVIDNTGTVIDIKARAPHNELAVEAERILKSLPKMIPGKQDGKAVSVPYSLPISFKIEK